MKTTTLATLLLAVALAACADGYSGQLVDDTVLTADEQLLQSIEEEYGTFDENGGFSLSGDASLAHSLTSRGHRWTVEDVKRNRPEARRLKRELTLAWTREYLAKMEGSNPPPASEYNFGTTSLAEEVARAKIQIGFVTNAIERTRLEQLPAAEQLREASKHLAKLKGPSPPSYPYLWSGAGDTLEDEIAFAEMMIEALRVQVSYESGNEGKGR